MDIAIRWSSSSSVTITVTVVLFVYKYLTPRATIMETFINGTPAIQRALANTRSQLTDFGTDEAKYSSILIHNAAKIDKDT